MIFTLSKKEIRLLWVVYIYYAIFVVLLLFTFIGFFLIFHAFTFEKILGEIKKNKDTIDDSSLKKINDAIKTSLVVYGILLLILSLFVIALIHDSWNRYDIAENLAAISIITAQFFIVFGPPIILSIMQLNKNSKLKKLIIPKNDTFQIFPF